MKIAEGLRCYQPSNLPTFQSSNVLIRTVGPGRGIHTASTPEYREPTSHTTLHKQAIVVAHRTPLLGGARNGWRVDTARSAVLTKAIALGE